jgi:hypothetical protein
VHEFPQTFPPSKGGNGWERCTWGAGNCWSGRSGFPWGDVLDSSPMSTSGTLGGFYRESGESGHLARLEAALPAEWSRTRDVAAAAGVADGGWTRRALEYLFEEGRVKSGWVFRLLAGGAGRGGSGGARRERRGEGPPAARAVVESTWEAPAAWRGVYAVGYAAAAGSCRWFVPPSRVGFSSAGGAAGMVSVNVKGGTGAGRRRVRELAEWVCGCPANEESAIEGGTRWVLRFRRQPGHRYSCSSAAALAGRMSPDRLTVPRVSRTVVGVETEYARGLGYHGTMHRAYG